MRAAPLPCSAPRRCRVTYMPCLRPSPRQWAHPIRSCGTCEARGMRQDTLPSYDLSNSDVVFSFGADFVGSWLSMTRYGTEYGNFRSQPRGLRGQLVDFEPHMSLTAAKADLWVPIHPGTEGLLAQAIAKTIADQKL